MARSRQYNRHQAQRAKARAKRFLKILDSQLDNKYKLSESNKHINFWANQRAGCSCDMCRDRKYRQDRARQKDNHKRNQR